MLAKRVFSTSLIKSISTLQSSTKIATAKSLFENSCYHKLDFKISHDRSVREVVARFSAFNVGSLAVTDEKNKLKGVITQSDVISKAYPFDKQKEEMKVKDVCTYGPNLIFAKTTDSLETCMNKMIFKDIRHLLIVDDHDESFIGLISMKDVIKEILKDKKETIMRLNDFNVGKGAFFGSE